jgi:hypothetical protein
MLSGTVARYRSYAADCIEIAHSVPTLSVRLEFLAMAKAWIMLANEPDKTGQVVSSVLPSNNDATSPRRPLNKWKLFIRDLTVSPPVEICSEHDSKQEAIERAYSLPPHHVAICIESPHSKRTEHDTLERANPRLVE